MIEISRSAELAGSAAATTGTITLRGFLNATSLLLSILSEQSIQQANQDFLQRTEEKLEYKPKVFYVMQSEYVQVGVEDEPFVLESGQATTCVIAVAHCPETLLTSIAHFDSDNHHAFFLWLQGMHRPDIYLMGDYENDYQVSVAKELLWYLYKRQDLIANIKLAFVRSVNTREDGFPLFYDMSYSSETRLPSPKLREAEGHPAYMHRLGYLIVGYSGMHNVYDMKTQRFHFPSFNVRPVRYYEEFKEMSDEVVLSAISTSPLHEPAGFLKDQKNLWDWLDVQIDEGNLVQPELWYECDADKNWILVEEEKLSSYGATRRLVLSK